MEVPKEPDNGMEYTPCHFIYLFFFKMMTIGAYCSCAISALADLICHARFELAS